MKRNAWTLLSLRLTIGFSLLFTTSPAHAASKKDSGTKINPSTVFDLTDAAGKSFKCAKVKGRDRAGTLRKGNLFTPLSKTLADLKKQAGSCKGKLSGNKKKLCNKYKKMKAQVSERDGLCQNGPDPLKQLNRPLTDGDVRYLYEKAAFGAPPQEAINIGLTQGVGPLVDYLMAVRLDPALDADSLKYLDENYNSDTTTVTDRGVRLWALNLLLKTSDPFNERLAFLFLHNLLATSMEVLPDGDQKFMMVDHLETIRAGAKSGDYPTLLKVITHDPVMLIWLSGSLNTKQRPNENFARELMELFTLAPKDAAGNINYSETTVAQVARACTGWKVTDDDSLCPSDKEWCPVFSAGNFDTDPSKVIFEGTPYQGFVRDDFDVIDHILAQHPNAPKFLAGRLLKEYLNESPSPQSLDSAAKFLKASGYNFRPLLAKLLKSEEFYNPANRNSIVKGPTDKLVQFLRTTGLPYQITSTDLLSSSDGSRPTGLDNAGQMLGMPPTVFGWDNPDWVNGAWLLNFVNTLNRLIKQDSLFNTRGFSYTQLLPSPTATAQDVVVHWSTKLNVNLTADQQNAIITYMNNRINSSNTVIPDAWDPANATKVRRKVAGVLEILARSNDYQMR